MGLRHSASAFCSEALESTRPAADVMSEGDANCYGHVSNVAMFTWIRAVGFLVSRSEM